MFRMSKTLKQGTKVSYQDVIQITGLSDLSDTLYLHDCCKCTCPLQTNVCRKRLKPDLDVSDDRIDEVCKEDFFSAEYVSLHLASSLYISTLALNISH